MTELERAQDRIAELEELLGLRCEVPTDWHLSKKERALFGLLLARRYLAREVAYGALWGGRDVGEKVLYVTIHNLRAKIRGRGISILCAHGVGHYIPDADKALARSLIAESQRRSYDAKKDFENSLAVGYQAIRTRMAAGGKGWEPR